MEELVRRMERHHIGVFEVRRAAIVYHPPRYETDRARPDGEDEPLGHR